MRKLLCIIAFIIAIISIFVSCERLENAPITEIELLDGKTPKALYGSSINKYKNHKKDGVPYHINTVWTFSENPQKQIVVDYLSSSKSIDYSVTETEENVTRSEGIVFLNGKIYCIDNDDNKYFYYTDYETAEKYINEKTRIKDITPALPDNIPNSWFDDVKFVPSENGEYYTVIADSKKPYNHPLYKDFYESDVECRVSFTKEGILHKVWLENVVINGEKSNLTFTFSWGTDGVKEPIDKDLFVDRGDFDFDKGHKDPGDKPPVIEHQHIPGDSVIENVVNSTCTVDGSYDMVVYCTDVECGVELSRQTNIVKAKGHNFVKGKCNVCGQPDPNYKPYSQGLEFTNNNDGTCYVSGSGTFYGTDLVIPEYSDEGYLVTKIGDYAFEDMGCLVTLTVPDSVTEIAYSAFIRTTLETVKLGNGITKIDDYAFAECDCLETVILGDSVTYVGDFSFAFCTSLEEIALPDSVTYLGGAAFFLCENLKQVKLPCNIEILDQELFEGCIDLKEVKIPENVTIIEVAAFSGSGINSITIPDSVTVIKEYAFGNCDSLASVYIPDSVVKIEDEAFADCSSLTSVRLPSNINDIEFLGKGVFSYCTSLVDIVAENDDYGYCVVDGNLVFTFDFIGYYLYQYALGKNNEIFEIDNSIYSIEAYAFAGAENLKSIVFNEGTSYIFEYAFANCVNLESVTFRKYINGRIGENAFENCMNLTDVYFSDTKEMWDGMEIREGNDFLIMANIHCDYKDE